MADKEFQEIAHCGGKVTFHVMIDEGIPMYTVEFSSSSPRPVSVFGIYALPQGNPVGDYPLGWQNHPSRAPPFPGCIPVFIASDQQLFFGHKCQRGCKGYWRSPGAPHFWPMTCPYCGQRGGTYNFRTDAHIRYTQHYIGKLMELLDDSTGEQSAVIDMDEIRDAEPQSARPDFYYTEESQQCRFTCEACGVANDILGYFGYCCSCGTRNNLQLLKLDIASVSNDANKGSAPVELVKRAVSSFDAFAKDYVVQLLKLVPVTPRRRKECESFLFHDVDKSEKFLKRYFDIDLLKGANTSDKQFVTMMFQRRHVYEHKAAVADARYLERSGDTSVKKGQAIRESGDHVQQLTEIVLRMATNVHEGFHQIIPPVQKAFSARSGD